MARPTIRLVSVGAHPVRDALRCATKGIAHRVRSYPFPVGLAAIPPPRRRSTPASASLPAGPNGAGVARPYISMTVSAIFPTVSVWDTCRIAVACSSLGSHAHAAPQRPCVRPIGMERLLVDFTRNIAVSRVQGADRARKKIRYAVQVRHTSSYLTGRVWPPCVLPESSCLAVFKSHGTIKRSQNPHQIPTFLNRKKLLVDIR